VPERKGCLPVDIVHLCQVLHPVGNSSHHPNLQSEMDPEHSEPHPYHGKTVFLFSHNIYFSRIRIKTCFAWIGMVLFPGFKILSLLIM
jgi:hypothetical protein